MFQRHLKQNITEALSDTPVMLLNGARQTGKSTLAKQLMADGYLGQYISLDNPAMLTAANADPMNFIRNYADNSIILDEIQRAPDLLLIIKMEVDKKRIPGRFFLTGSANILMLPKLSETLAGRMEILNLWPLSQGEINGKKETLIDNIFLNKSLPKNSTRNFDDLLTIVTKGGYPEILQRSSDRRRKTWFESYTITILQQDIRDLSNIEKLNELPNLLKLLAVRCSTLLNIAELSRSSGFSQTTLNRYLSLLKATFLIHTVQAWSNNHNKRLVRSPKIMLNDSSLITYLLGFNTKRLQNEPHLFGPILENFVVNELKKQSTWSEVQWKLFHFRTQTGQEVDIILESPEGKLIALEIKSSSKLSRKDLKGLKLFQEITDKKFMCGLVCYTGSEIIPLGEQLWAIPIQMLWQ